jgi:hypothetical protein
MSVGVSDHLRSTDPDDDDAIYRVVGATPDSVTLLRVSDGDGRRANTGEVITVPRDSLDSFESAPNPDDTRSLLMTLRSTASGAYWSLRGAPLLRQAGLGLLAVGLLVDVAGLPVPTAAVDFLLLAGVVTLVLSWLRY